MKNQITFIILNFQISSLSGQNVGIQPPKRSKFRPQIRPSGITRLHHFYVFFLSVYTRIGAFRFLVWSPSRDKQQVIKHFPQLFNSPIGETTCTDRIRKSWGAKMARTSSTAMRVWWGSCVARRLYKSVRDAFCIFTRRAVKTWRE